MKNRNKIEDNFEQKSKVLDQMESILQLREKLVNSVINRKDGPFDFFKNIFKKS